VFVADHSWIGSSLTVVENWAVPVVAVATFALWLFSRPGSSRKWKLACASALASAGLALLIGAHYPADVLAGCLVGFASAILAARLARPVMERVVRQLERITDPVLASIWRFRTARQQA
jgi:membrane-associated phospholipid phosphatase